VWVSNDFKLVYGQDMAKFLPIVSDPAQLARYLDSIDVDCPLYDLLCAADDLEQERENRKIPANMNMKAVIAELKIRRGDSNAIQWRSSTKKAALNELLVQHRERRTGNDLVAAAEAAAAGAGAAGDMAVDEQAVGVGEEEEVAADQDLLFGFDDEYELDDDEA
jgi:hypothetical protein